LKNSVIYLTRACPRKCSYCGIINPVGLGTELGAEEWEDALEITRILGVDFNLFLGNEPWLLGSDLLRVLLSSNTSYGLYTSCFKSLFDRYKEMFFRFGIKNFSCGVDYPSDILSRGVYSSDAQMVAKAIDAWAGLRWVRTNFPEVETHATITINNSNYLWLEEIVDELSDLGVFSNINGVHYNKDGGYDFFSDEAYGLTLKKQDYSKLGRIFNRILETRGLVQNMEMLLMGIDKFIEMGWHCNGDPYGGPTIDSDGSLRCCGYRKGTRTCNLSIFDLPKLESFWTESVYKDAMDCPGCSWSCSWMYHYWKDKDEMFGEKVFANHARRSGEKQKKSYSL